MCKNSEDIMEEIPVKDCRTEEESSVPVHDGVSSLPQPEESLHRRYKEQDIHRLPSLSVIFGCFVLVIVIISAVVATAPYDKDGDATNASSNLRSSSSRDSHFRSVVGYIVSQGITDRYVLEVSGTAQNRAAMWLAFEDAANLPVPIDKDSLEAMKYTTRYVLAVDYFALHGDHWFYKDTSFLSSSDICQWNNGQHGVFCDENEYPQQINLASNNMVGDLPPENGFLHTLKEFDVAKNALFGTLSSELCGLSNLESFDLHANQFMGELPSCIGEFESLGVFRASQNLLHGSLPTEWAKLSNLHSLRLDDNHLNGDPTSTLNQLTGIKEMYISGNEFFGYVDGDFLDGHESLVRLDISKNNFTSVSFPAQLINSQNIEILDLSENQIEGTFPDELPLHGKLVHLAAYRNLIEGNIPDTIASLKVLKHLDLANNKITGGIPSTIGNMGQLQYLSLSDNSFSPGPIPATFADMRNLQVLSLQNTGRTGNLPEFLSELENLALLDLGINSLGGSIPESYGNLAKLSFLLLNDNAIEGGVPASFNKLEHLQHIYLDGTEMTGNVDALCHLKDETYDEHDQLVIFADCGGSSIEIECSCGCQCCQGNASRGCSQSQMSDWDWEHEFRHWRENV